MRHKVILWRGYTEIETHARPSQKKMLGLFGIFYIGAPRALSYELMPAKQVLPEGTAAWNQAIQLDNTHLERTPDRPLENQALVGTNGLCLAIKKGTLDRRYG